MTEDEKSALWKELLEGFKLNDKVGIMDCLARRAPVDVHDENGEYAIHLAARFGDTSILDRIH